MPQYEAMKLGGWQRLSAEYARQFVAIETPNSPLKALKSRESRRKNPMELTLQKSATPAS